jgi:hypothetical protein
VTVTERTRYPFDEKVVLEVSTPEPTTFPLYVRIPGWCEDAGIKLNDESVSVKAKPRAYVRLERRWQEGDEVVLRFPMEIEVQRWERNEDSLSVSRGPLGYSLKIEEEWVSFEEKEGWPGYEVHPESPWNYGLVVDSTRPEESFELVKQAQELPERPFRVQNAPVKLRARGRRIPGWELDALGLVEGLQKSPVKSDKQLKKLTLIPMGCARLRITAFPVLGNGPDADRWSPEVDVRCSGDAAHGSPEALNDNRRPLNSNDPSCLRFRWSAPESGGPHWVSYVFPEQRKVSRCRVYWSAPHSNPKNAPDSWRLLWKDGDKWKPVKGVQEYGTRLDQFNTVTFQPVTTTSLKLEVHFTRSGGILEWDVSKGE